MVPQSRALPVLITRPQPQASRFALALTDRYGARVMPVLTPLLAPAFFHTDLPAGFFGSVILTSETGARAAAALAGDLPSRAFCVGDRTATVAAQAGFQARSAAGDADALFQLLLGQPEHAPFLHLRGREARGDLAVRLRAAGLSAQEAVVYAQEPQCLTTEARNVLEGAGPVLVPLFSPRSAEVFRRALSDIPEGSDIWGRLRIAALSPAIAAIFPECPFQHIAIATTPTQAELFSALDRFIFIA
jgi:uroporphyrinogen-III synthase